MQKDTFSLKDIYTYFIDGKIKLPLIQRGFVWNPYQIENLWDSLLRGYPIGSIVLHPREENNQTFFELLDGQQRITAICLGMLDRNNENIQRDILKLPTKNMRIFIDLAKPNPEDTRKYIFRVITRSHPWGYQKNDNTRTLEVKKIREALEEIGKKHNTKIEKYYEMPLENFYPYDAVKPYPWDLFMNASNLEYLKQSLEEWERKYWNGQERNKEEIECYKIEDIYKLVNEIRNVKKIPAIYIDFSALLKQQNIHNDDTIDDIENLFIRLNSAGTPLTAEELNYSILKSHIDSELQNKIEKACNKLFRPSRFITIAYWLWDASKKNKFPRLSIKPRQFQKEIQNSLDEFKKVILELIDDRIININDKQKTILEYVEYILKYSEENKIGLPFVTVCRLSNMAPEMMFMLLYRVYISKDRFDLESDLHRQMLGIITMFTWLGKGETLRDYSKLLRNIFPALTRLDTERFWSWETVQRAKLEYDEQQVLLDVLSKKQFMEKINNLLEIKPNSKQAEIERLGTELNFFKKLAFEKDLLLFCQRKFLYEYFDEKIFMLDDTNMPFDYDHLFPQSYIRRKKGIRKTLKDWYNSIGNLRAWPYEMNKSDSDRPPYEKLKDKLDDKNVLKISCCSNEWKNNTIDSSNIKSKWIDVYKLIMKRNLNLCKTWYDEFLIDNLVRKQEEINLLECFYNKKWKKKKTEDWDNFYQYNITDNICMTIAYDNDYFLHDEGIEFSLIEEFNNNESNLYHVYNHLNKTNLYQKAEDDESFYIYNYFTLLSMSKHSIKMLLEDINNWLKGLGTLTLNNKTLSLSEIFKESIKKEFRPE